MIPMPPVDGKVPPFVIVLYAYVSIARSNDRLLQRWQYLPRSYESRSYVIRLTFLNG